MNNFTQRFCISLSVLILMVSGCSKNTTTQISSPVPSTTVNVSINVNSPGYTSLQTIGGTAYVANAGYRGILLYRLNATQMMGYDRTCTYDIADVNGIVNVQTGGTATCPECASIYNLLDGSVNTGPTTLPLQAYTVAFTPSTGVVKITH